MDGYIYKVVDIARQFPRHGGNPFNALRSWCRKGLVEAHHHAPNAEWRLTARGVGQAWALWAQHKELNPVNDMPKGIRAIIDGDSGSDGNGTVRVTIQITIEPSGRVEVLQKND